MAALAIAVLLLAAPLAADPGPDSDPVGDADAYIARAESAWAKVESYTAKLTLRERYNGKLRGWEYADYAFKRPERVSIRWNDPGLYAGLCVSYVAGRDGLDHFLALGEGLKSILGVRRWANDSAFVQRMYPHRFPPKNTHIGFMLAHARETLDRAEAIGKRTVEEPTRVRSELVGRELVRIETRFSSDPADGLPYGRAVMYFDEGGTDLPLQVELYDHAGRMLGVWAFKDIAINVDVPDARFDLAKE